MENYSTIPGDGVADDRHDGTSDDFSDAVADVLLDDRGVDRDEVETGGRRSCIAKPSICAVES